MAVLPTDFKTGKCLEWYTQLPSHFWPRNSPVFIIQNVECYFSFSRDTSYFYLYIKTKETYAQLKSFSFTIYANYDGATTDKLNSKTATFQSSGMQVIRFSNQPFINKAVNFPFKYLFVFKNDVCLILPSEKKKGKLIQTGSYLNSNVSVESLPDDFSKLLETGLNHDAVMKCGEHSLNVHKAVLSARSEVFKAMLESDFLEGQTGIVQIQMMDACYFREFVHYLYTGTMPELTYNKAKTLYEAGDKYSVRSLVLRCSEYLQDNLTEENALECFLLCDAHSDQKLKEEITNFILEKNLYLEDEFWAPFCEKFPKFANELYRLSYKKRKIEKDE